MAHATLCGSPKGRHDDPINVGNRRRPQEEHPLDRVERREGGRIREIERHDVDRAAELESRGRHIVGRDTHGCPEAQQLTDKWCANVSGSARHKHLCAHRGAVRVTGAATPRQA